MQKSYQNGKQIIGQLGIRVGIFTAGQDITILLFHIVVALLVKIMCEKMESGDLNQVSRYAVLSILGLGLFCLLRIAYDSFYARLYKEAETKCKLNLYNCFADARQQKLTDFTYGSLKEVVSDDLSFAFALYSKYYPHILVGLIDCVLYTWLLYEINIKIVSCAWGISLLQLLPVYLVRHVQVKNYDNCREIEAELSNHILSGINGFEIIKGMRLERCWVKHLDRIHEQYIRVGQATDSWAAIRRMLQRLSGAISIFGTYITLGLLCSHGIMSFGQAFSSVIIVRSMCIKVADIFSIIPSMITGRHAFKRISHDWCDGIERFCKTYESECIIRGTEIIVQVSSKRSIRYPNFSFSNQKRYLICGLNGSGKSTWLKLLAGYYTPQKGKLYIDLQNKVDENLEPYVFYCQQEDIVLDVTVEEFLAFFHCERRMDIIDYLIKFQFDYERLKKRIIKDLSGGERKRLLLSVAFSLHPAFLLLDEPYTNLDQGGVECLNSLIKERGGVLIVHHGEMQEELINEKITLQIENV